MTSHRPFCRAPFVDQSIPAAYFDRRGLTYSQPENLCCMLPFGHHGPHRCETHTPHGGMTMTCSHMWGECTLICKKCGEREFDELSLDDDPSQFVHGRNDEGEHCGGTFARLTESEARAIRKAQDGVETT